MHAGCAHGVRERVAALAGRFDPGTSRCALGEWQTVAAGCAGIVQPRALAVAPSTAVALRALTTGRCSMPATDDIFRRDDDIFRGSSCAGIIQPRALTVTPSSAVALWTLAAGRCSVIAANDIARSDAREGAKCEHSPHDKVSRAEPAGCLGGVSSGNQSEIRTPTAQILVIILNFGVLLFVLFEEPAHLGMLMGMWWWWSAWVRFRRAKKLARLGDLVCGRLLSCRPLPLLS